MRIGVWIIWIIAISLSMGVAALGRDLHPDHEEPSQVEPVEVGPKEYTDKVRRNYHLRSLGTLNVTNRRGSIQVQGWPLDKLRVDAIRTATASSAGEARELLASADVAFREVDGEIELSADYGKGLELQEKLKERKNPQAKIDLVIRAPSSLKLKVWAVDHAVSVEDWNEDVHIRSTSGTIQIENVNTDRVSMTCSECRILGRNLKSSVHCVGGSQGVDLSQVKGKDIYVETQTGDQKISAATGSLFLISKEGKISGKTLEGTIEFRNQIGAVEIEESLGSVHGKTISGPVKIQLRKWMGSGKSLLETEKGPIELQLPKRFSGDLFAKSTLGTTEVEFSLKPLTEAWEARRVGPFPANHIMGRIGNGGEILEVSSEEGNIQILKGP